MECILTPQFEYFSHDSSLILESQVVISLGRVSMKSRLMTCSFVGEVENPKSHQNQTLIGLADQPLNLRLEIELAILTLQNSLQTPERWNITSMGL